MMRSSSAKGNQRNYNTTEDTNTITSYTSENHEPNINDDSSSDEGY
jgi:hypothetical protein